MFITLASLVIIFFFLEVVGLTNFIQTPLQKIFTPVQLAFYKSGKDVENFLGTITSIKGLKERETAATYENAWLRAENASLKKLEGENKALREQLGAPRLGEDLILAQVIGHDPLLGSSDLLVDKGRSRRVKVGYLVVIKNILVGEVVRVGDSTAVVRLLTDSGTKIPAETENQVGGIVRGEFGNRIILDKVAQGEKLKVGEIVFSSGAADIPKGLVLGEVEKIENNPAEIFQKATIKPLAPYDKLDTLFIINAGG